MTTENKKQNIVHKIDGVVIACKMAKTIVVKVDNVKVHSKYHKRYVKSTKFKVHDEKQQFKVGDKVTFIACRPISKEKKWRVIYNKQ
ncbi:MAG: 30S ribosomal protein S17 [Patescibacteria group bacterium]|jgi:small subunit ribosomal protein S17